MWSLTGIADLSARQILRAAESVGAVSAAPTGLGLSLWSVTQGFALGYCLLSLRERDGLDAGFRQS